MRIVPTELPAALLRTASTLTRESQNTQSPRLLFRALPNEKTLQQRRFRRPNRGPRRARRAQREQCANHDGAATTEPPRRLDKMCLLIEAFDSLCVPTCHPFLSGRPSRMQAIGLFHRRRLPGRRGSRAPPARQKPRGVPQDLQDRLRGSGPMPTAGLAPRGRREDNGTKTAMREE
jgi:hypothetical protein